MRLLAWLGRQGRFVLPVGLGVALISPELARLLAPTVVPLLAALLLLAALRIGPEAALPRPAELPAALGLTVVLQLVPPLLALAGFAALGWLGHPAAVGVVLVLAASPIVGAPGLAILSGADPAPALRLLVLGTALLPLTALPVLGLLPLFEGAGGMLAAVLRLMVVIGLAGGLGFVLRARVPALGTVRARAAIDGLNALGMAVLVVGLTAALGPALRAGDPALWAMLALATVLNFASQAGVFALACARGVGPRAPAVAIAAGNRNLALFLAALPPEAASALALFIGAYQVPMFLTPLVLAPLYRLALPAARAGAPAKK